MSGSRQRVLVLGYGNPGRLDDGLGPAAVAALAALQLDGVRCDSNYQLTVEDAVAVAEHDVVVFVDAAVSGREPFAFESLRPSADTSFTTHHLEPAAVLFLACDTFGARPEAYTLAIRGYEFDAFGEHLSSHARRNLRAAVHFLAHVVLVPALRSVAAGAEDQHGPFTDEARIEHAGR